MSFEFVFAHVGSSGLNPPPPFHPQPVVAIIGYIFFYAHIEYLSGNPSFGLDRRECTPHPCTRLYPSTKRAYIGSHRQGRQDFDYFEVLYSKGWRQKKVVPTTKWLDPPPSCGQSTTFLCEILYLLRIPWYGKIIEQIGNWNFHPSPTSIRPSQKTQSKSTKDPTQDRVEHTN